MIGEDSCTISSSPSALGPFKENVSFTSLVFCSMASGLGTIAVLEAMFELSKKFSFVSTDDVLPLAA